MNPGLVEHVTASMQDAMTRVAGAALRVLPDVLTTVVILGVFWGLASLATRLARFGSQYVANPTQRNLIRQVAYYVVWAIGVLVALDALGVDAQALATGLGLGGIALGFALKDILSNLVSGLLILLTRTFDINDQIVVGSTEGTVERIQVRATHIRTYDGRLVLVPNGEVFMSRVINNTDSRLRRASIRIHLDYQQDLPQVFGLVATTLSTLPCVAPSPAPALRVRDLGPTGVEIEARFWTDSRRTEYMDASSDARLAVLAALRGADVGLPNPDRRLVTVVEDQTEHDDQAGDELSPPATTHRMPA